MGQDSSPGRTFDATAPEPAPAPEPAALPDRTVPAPANAPAGFPAPPTPSLAGNPPVLPTGEERSLDPRGVRGQSAFQGGRYGAAWALGFTVMGALSGAIGRVIGDFWLRGMLINSIAVLIAGLLLAALVEYLRTRRRRTAAAHA